MEKSLEQRWQLKDFVFGAFMAIGCLVTAALVVPLTLSIPLPGLRTVVWAPLGGIFLTLGMARLKRSGTIAYIIGLQALISARITWVITALLGLAILITELVMLLRGGYCGRSNRLLANLIFFGATVPAGAVLAGFGIGKEAATYFVQPWVLVPMTLAGVGAGALGWWLGEQIVAQLQKAGKLDAGE